MLHLGVALAGVLIYGIGLGLAIEALEDNKLSWSQIAKIMAMLIAGSIFMIAGINNYSAQ